jgi:acyl-CoA thioesterase-1
MLSLIPDEFMRRLLRGVLLLLLITLPPAPSRAENGAAACDIPTEFTAPSEPLPRVAAALSSQTEASQTRASQTGASKPGLTILALGSGSTVGDSGAAGGPALAFHAPGASFPFRMLEALRNMRPSDRFELTVKGGRSMTAETMLPILRQELAARHYDLVLWQTGTVEAVLGQRPDALRGVLQDGADAVATAGADLVLIDPQFSRFLRANADLNPYQTVLQQMATAAGVTLFHRFDLTQGWVTDGQIDVERVDKDQRDKTIMLLNNCLGQALAQFILTGAEQH